MKGPPVSTEHLLCPRQHAWQFSMCELILQHPCKEDTNIPIFDRAGDKPRDIKELSQDHTARDFPGGPVVKNPPAKKKKKNPPANTGDTGSIPGPGRSHIPQGS